MATRAKRRTKKGAIAIASRNGMLNLRWTHEQRRYQLAIGLENTPTNQQTAREKAADIEVDMAKGQFDPTLDKYRPGANAEAESTILTTVEMWRRWTEQKRVEGVCEYNLSNKYRTTLRHLERFGRDIESKADAQEFLLCLREKQNPETANRTMSDLRGFFAWAIEQEWIATNPTTGIKRVKDSNPPPPPKEPFSPEEIHQILKAFREHPKAHCYHDFAVVLIALGLRPSEAIGLRWSHVNWKQRTITIMESLSRSGKGSGRARRGRKNAVATVIDMPEYLHAMLQGRFTPEVKPDDLIFTSATGKTINDNNFSQRYWKPILNQAGVEHRPPYNSRHTMASHALDQKLSQPEVAYLLGHRDTTMVSKVYGHKVGKPQLPDLGFQNRQEIDRIDSQ